MLLYPDRFYIEENVCEFFESCADHSTNPIYIHGMWMRKGNGGTWDFTASVINRLSKHPNILGMKEETSSIDLAYKILQEVTDDFDIIVAGGSMRRHWHLSNAKKDISFLSGVGSIFPEYACTYCNEYNSMNLIEAKKVMNNFEKPLFNVFMEIGWHASLRYALSEMGYIKENRLPFIEINNEQKDKINTIISELKLKNQ
jgi:dihydrodipicolinate synthase/N-acetylneuraminate lyase